MALIKVQWREVKEFEAQVEIDGFFGTDDEIKEALGDLPSEVHEDAQFDGTVVELQSVVTIRASDQRVPVKVAAKQHEDMF